MTDQHIRRTVRQMYYFPAAGMLLGGFAGVPGGPLGVVLGAAVGYFIGRRYETRLVLRIKAAQADGNVDAETFTHGTVVV